VFSFIRDIDKDKTSRQREEVRALKQSLESKPHGEG
jgi:hypothetical protein